MQRLVVNQYCLILASLVTVTTLASPALAQSDSEPYLGSWRGNAASADGTTTAVVLTVAAANSTYGGVMSGFGPGREAPLTSVTIADGMLMAETSVDSRLGLLSVRYELSLNEGGDILSGVQQLIFGNQRIVFDVELKKRRRRDVPQPQVKQRIGYFVGTWAFDYTGGEFPPLSIGTRSGRVQFTQRGDSSWVDGQVTGDVYGDTYEEHLVIGYDPENRFLVFQEMLSNDIELLSVANWQSPIGINFVTTPVEHNGQSYQLRRVIAVTSETAFRVTEEFSIDGGPFRRLGNADYRRVD